MLKVRQTEIYEQPRGQGINKYPPERLRTQMKIQTMKIVKFAEGVSKEGEACGYTCLSLSQGVRESWKVAKVSRESVLPRNNTTVVLLIVSFQT